jgi:hypothetical protein
MFATGAAHAACIVVSAKPDGAALAHVAVDAQFRIVYVHSVTRTPVEEIYRVEGDTIVQTEIRFVEHGPGLPTAPDAGGTFERRDGTFVVRGRRSFDAIVMRVDAGQAPTLVAGDTAIDLARWGNRALAVRAQAGSCGAP